MLGGLVDTELAALHLQLLHASKMLEILACDTVSVFEVARTDGLIDSETALEFSDVARL